MNENINVRLTRVDFLKHVSSCWYNNYYFLAHGRVYTDPTCKRFYKIKFVVWFDIFDLQEWIEPDDDDEHDDEHDDVIINDDVARDYAKELSINWLYTYVPKDVENNAVGRREMFEAANQTINEYNN